MSASIRPAADADWPLIWALFRRAAESGEVFAYDEYTTEETARKLWFDAPATAFVCEVDGTFAGTYYVRPNQPGRGAHVANAGYMVELAFRGRGLAASMCEHSLGTARERGFTAMQFNFVVSTNAAAVRAWQKCGFAVAATLPGAYRHRDSGFVDVFVMWRAL